MKKYNKKIVEEPAPYADEWKALREQRQREFELMITLSRWGALLDITNEIAKECGIEQTPVVQKSPSTRLSAVSRFSPYAKGRL